MTCRTLTRRLFAWRLLARDLRDVLRELNN